MQCVYCTAAGNFFINPSLSLAPLLGTTWHQERQKRSSWVLCLVPFRLSGTLWLLKLNLDSIPCYNAAVTVYIIAMFFLVLLFHHVLIKTFNY